MAGETSPVATLAGRSSASNGLTGSLEGWVGTRPSWRLGIVARSRPAPASRILDPAHQSGGPLPGHLLNTTARSTAGSSYPAGANRQDFTRSSVLMGTARRLWGAGGPAQGRAPTAAIRLMWIPRLVQGQRVATTPYPIARAPRASPAPRR